MQPALLILEVAKSPVETRTRDDDNNNHASRSLAFFKDCTRVLEVPLFHHWQDQHQQQCQQQQSHQHIWELNTKKKRREIDHLNTSGVTWDTNKSNKNSHCLNISAKETSSSTTNNNGSIICSGDILITALQTETWSSCYSTIGTGYQSRFICIPMD